MSGVFGLLPLVLASATIAVAESVPTGMGSEPHITGFYLGFGFVSNHVDLDLSEDSYLGGAGIDLDGSSNGVDFFVGWGFGPHFLLEGHALASDLDAKIAGKSVTLAAATLESVVPLGPAAPVQPYVSTGIGAVVLGVDIPEGDAAVELGILGKFGGGLLIRLTDHLTVSASYRFSMLNFEREFLSGTAEDRPADGIPIGGSGKLQAVSLQLVLDF